MQNILYIQGEKFGRDSYLFVNTTNIIEKNRKVDIISSNYLSINNFDFLFKKSENPYCNITKKYLNGFLISGLLNEKDSGGRLMVFTCYYTGNMKELNNYLNNCLSQINKTVNKESIKLIEKTLENYQKFKTMIIAGIIVLTGYAVLKSINIL